MSLQATETKTDRLKQYLNVMTQIKPLEEAQEKECLSQMAAGDEQARRHLVESFLPRVVAWVREYRGAGLRFDELIELGNQALVVGAWSASRRGVLNLAAELEQVVRRDVEQAIKEAEKA